MTRRDRYDSLFQFWTSTRAAQLDWRWLKAQAIAESNLDPKAMSPAGAEGLAQVMPATWREVMGDADPFNPEQSIIAQATYMAMLYGRFQDVTQATAAYNCGAGRVGGLLRVYGADWRAHAPRETRDYLVRIESFYTVLSEATA